MQCRPITYLKRINHAMEFDKRITMCLFNELSLAKLLCFNFLDEYGHRVGK